MPSTFRGPLAAALFAIFTLCCTASADAAAPRIVRGTADATVRPSWVPGAWVRQHAYGLDPAELAAHPEWQLKDASNTPLYIGTRAAADFGNAAFRSWWIAKAQAATSGARGLYVDDAFMERRATNLSGTSRTPIDPRTGAAMTEANWQKYMADFLVAVRAALPSAEIVHDVLWYKGDSGTDVLRAIQAANFLSVDGGFNGALVTYGGGTYGYQTLAGFIEREQARGGGVILDFPTTAAAARMYGLASYLLVGNGISAIANDASTTPLWAGYTVDVGTPNTGRYQVATGTWRRDFTRGIVLVNEPYRATRTITVPDGYRDLDGVPRTSVTLAGGQGAVLVPIPVPVSTPTPTPTPVAPTETGVGVSTVSVPPVATAPPSAPTKITTVSTGGNGARIARAGGTAGAKAPGSTRVSVRGSRTKLVGSVKGAVAGYVRVTIERKRGAKWAIVRRVKVAVKRTGRFTKDIPTLPSGSYRVSGYFEGTGTSKPARSGYSTF
ncbi:putative glycoside hydrolase family 15 protein [Solirubrobacter phytolaccae]|uniref:Glycoside hydrolase family 15 protein n=1 Tax=Solirubrobacter phytolaccae TaxID=1404360 RepID=A0A9X3ND69_9ACTN|nr:putative glycoside hydrolase [Solirubrobacter phytolaccae]MDA0183009.1 putative glycoside hydrolase family 15 protein [Solirubrobacter phytolaccae]